MAFWTHSSTKEDDLHPKMKDRFLVIMGGSKHPFSSKIMFTVKSIDKPSVSIETKDFKLMNHKFKYPGQVTWESIKMTLVDMAGSGQEKHRVLPGSDNAMDFATAKYIDSEIRWDPDFRAAFGNPNFENSSAALAYLLYGSGYDTPGFTAAAGKSNNTGLSKTHLNSMLQNLTIQQLAHSPLARRISGRSDGATENTKQIWVVEQWTLKNPIIKAISCGSLGYADEGLIEYTIDIDYDFAEVNYNKKKIGDFI